MMILMTKHLLSKDENKKKDSYFKKKKSKMTILKLICLKYILDYKLLYKPLLCQQKIVILFYFRDKYQYVTCF